MDIKVQIVADSLNAFNGKRLTTFYVEYERFFHQEVLTHRRPSRNSASSRAIPTNVLLGMVEGSPVLPTFIGVNCKGMAAQEDLQGAERVEFLTDVLTIRDAAVRVGKKWAGRVHKQNVNRYLEAFMPIGVVLTATEWGNFFWLRHSPAADPHFRRLADQMCEAYHASVPAPLMSPLDVHAPYIGADDWAEAAILGWVVDDLLFVSGARCGRASYFKAGDGSDRSLDDERQKGTELALRRHWSPLEHQAFAANVGADYQSGNFFGFEQFRKRFAGEDVSEVYPLAYYRDRERND